MKVNSFIKRLNHAKKDYPNIQKYIDCFESGLITFDECLKVIAEEHHAGIYADAVRENRG